MDKDPVGVYRWGVIASTPPATRPSVAIYWWGLALTVLLVGLLVLDNRQCLLDTPLYESSDLAANSLFVHEAKSHFVIHGHYSRWQFYHPGPVLFYVYALGEIVFHDWLHVAPAPLNGQTLGICLVLTLLFSLALVIFAQRLGAARGGYVFFLPLALLFAVWHYGAAESTQSFTATWPACPLILVFLCFVVATASVGSGGGRELPLVAFTGGWLVHNHVAQPLFVVPMTLLAYGGLLAACRTPPARVRGLLTAGWRSFPRAHLIAAGILAVFILPLLLDALHGKQSNFYRIWSHLHEPHEPMNKLARSFCYFLTFGSYEYYNPAEILFGKYSAAGMLAFVELHWRAYLCWTVALVGAPVLFAVARQITAATPPDSAQPAPRRRCAFLGWFGVMTGTAFILTLYWGMKQEGPMFYFNSYFNFSIFFCVALGLASALAAFLQATTAAPHLRRARAVISAALVFGVGAAAFNNAGAFENKVIADPAGVPLVKATNEAAGATLPPGAVCYLNIQPWDLWPEAIGIALQLTRLGREVRVNDNWFIMFGEDRAFSHDGLTLDKPLVHWSVVPIPASPARFVTAHAEIKVTPLANLDPAGGKIRFALDGNWEQYAFVGWAPPDNTWSWEDQPLAMLQFRPLPLPADNASGVDMIIDAESFVTEKAPTAQHVEVFFAGTLLSTVALPVHAEQPPPRVHVTADQWRAACAKGFAKVLFRFPDARSPYLLGLNGDRRVLGGGFRSIEFQVTP